MQQMRLPGFVVQFPTIPELPSAADVNPLPVASAPMLSPPKAKLHRTQASNRKQNRHR